MNYLLAASLVLFVLTGCQTGAETFPTIQIPQLPNDISPVESPVILKIGPLSRRASIVSDTRTETISGSDRQSERVRMSGHVDATQYNSGVQVTYSFDKIDQGSGMQVIPTLNIQIEFSEKGAAKDVRIGGPLLAQAKPEDRQQLDTFGKGLAGAFSRVIPDTPLAQGDVVFQLRALDIVKELLPATRQIRNTSSSGAGFAARLIGKTTKNGRLLYVLSWQGTETLTNPELTGTISVNGFYLIDAQSGLYAAADTVTQTSGRRNGVPFLTQELDTFSITF